MDRSQIGDNPIVKTIEGAGFGLAAGCTWGAIVAILYDKPHVEKNVARPELIRTLKVCGSYGLAFAAMGGIYVGVEQLLQKQRMKRDFVNGAAGAFVAGASVLGLKGRSISSAITSGSALALTSVILDYCVQTTKNGAGKPTHD